MKRWVKRLIFTQMLLLLGVFGRGESVSAEVVTEKVMDVESKPIVDEKGNLSIQLHWQFLGVYIGTEPKATAMVIYRSEADDKGEWGAYKRVKQIELGKMQISKADLKAKKGYDFQQRYTYVDNDGIGYGKYYRYRIVPFRGKKKMPKNGDTGYALTTPPTAAFTVANLAVTSNIIGLHFTDNEWQWIASKKTPKHEKEASINYLAADGFVLYKKRPYGDYWEIYDCPKATNVNLAKEGFYIDFIIDKEKGNDYKICTYTMVGKEKKLGHLSKILHVDAYNIPGQFDLEILDNKLISGETEEGGAKRQIEIRITSDKRNASLVFNNEWDGYRDTFSDILVPSKLSASWDGTNWFACSGQAAEHTEQIELKPGESIYLRILCEWLCEEDDIFKGVYYFVTYGGKRYVFHLEPQNNQAYVFPDEKEDTVYSYYYLYGWE